jgi:hypothetical protein
VSGRRVPVAQGLRDGRRRERPDARPDARPPHLKRQLHAAHLTRLGQEALHRELEVVDLLEREVHALGDAADNQPHDGLKIARQRRLEVNAFKQLVHLGSPMVPSPTTRS